MAMNEGRQRQFVEDYLRGKHMLKEAKKLGYDSVWLTAAIEFLDNLNLSQNEAFFAISDGDELKIEHMELVISVTRDLLQSQACNELG